MRNKSSVESITSDVVTFYICEKRDKDGFPDLLRHIRP